VPDYFVMLVVDVSNILVAEHSLSNLFRIRVETYGELQLLLDDLINFSNRFDHLRAI
jgi:hypothetical protein